MTRCRPQPQKNSGRTFGRGGQSRQLRPVEGPIREWGRRKQIGSGRGSHRARARIAPSCAALLGRRRSRETLLRHRMSAWVPRVPARGVVADVTRNECVGRKGCEMLLESTTGRVSKGLPRFGRCQQDNPVANELEPPAFRTARSVKRVRQNGQRDITGARDRVRRHCPPIYDRATCSQISSSNFKAPSNSLSRSRLPATSPSSEY